MRDLSKLSDSALVERKKNIESRTAYWKGSTDGSYEAALDAEGYYEVQNEIRHRKLKREQGDNDGHKKIQL